MCVKGPVNKICVRESVPPSPPSLDPGENKVYKDSELYQLSALLSPLPQGSCKVRGAPFTRRVQR